MVAEPTPQPLIEPGDVARAAATALAAFTIGYLVQVFLPLVMLPSHTRLSRALALGAWAAAMGLAALPEGWARSGRVRPGTAVACACAAGAVGVLLALVTLLHALAAPGALAVTTLGALLRAIAAEPILLWGLAFLGVLGGAAPLTWTLAVRVAAVEERRAQERFVATMRRAAVVGTIAGGAMLVALMLLAFTLRSATSGMDVVLMKLAYALVLPGALLAGLVSTGALDRLTGDLAADGD